MREKSKQEWQEGLDHAAHAELFGEVLSKAHAAIEAGEPPNSATGEAIAREWITASAHLSGREPDETFEGIKAEHVRPSNYGRSGSPGPGAFTDD
jgi:hypothetical protein